MYYYKASTAETAILASHKFIFCQAIFHTAFVQVQVQETKDISIPKCHILQLSC
jgi:hypothetical protein